MKLCLCLQINDPEYPVGSSPQFTLPLTHLKTCKHVKMPLLNRIGLFSSW